MSARGCNCYPWSAFSTDAKREALHYQLAKAIADADEGPASTRWLRQADAVLTVLDLEGVLGVPQ